ncbi:MAG: M48 family metalloprotease [Candidatus Saccharibacteria bacterium]
MYSEISANKRKTWLIMALFVVIIGVLGWIVSAMYNSPSLLYVAFGAGTFYALIEYFVAARLALVANGAHEIQKRDNPRLFRTVENLTIATGMPMPKIYIIDDPSPNAFATGRDPNNASVCVTTGLLQMMNDSELEAVMAHELGHVKNYDIRVMMIVFGLVSAISLIADIILRLVWWGDDEERNPVFLVLGIVAAIIAPLVAFMVQMAVSRRREYLADSTSALTTRYPEGLISALQKIGQYGRPMRKQNTATAHLFFANPLKSNGITKLFSTHPPIEDRIKRLQEMGAHA